MLGLQDIFSSKATDYARAYISDGIIMISPIPKMCLAAYLTGIALIEDV